MAICFLFYEATISIIKKAIDGFKHFNRMLFLTEAVVHLIMNKFYLQFVRFDNSVFLRLISKKDRQVRLRG